jgi:Ca2+-transporting ATPase
MIDSPVGEVANAEHAWHTLESSRVVDALSSSAERGLLPDEAAERLAHEGPNEILEAKRRGPLRMFIAQFADAMVLVLIGAAIVAGVVGEPQDIAAIFAIVLLDAGLGFIQEYRAERAVAALKAMSALTARVRRGGRETAVPAADLVPGDVVLLEPGNVVPADLRLVEVKRLRIDEATLTGESLPVEKLTAAIPEPTLPLGDRRNMAYKATTVTYGRAVGVVVATGMRTELGRIATLLRHDVETRTPLQDRLGRFGRNLAVTVLALCAVIFIVGLLRGEPPTLMFMTALSLAVAAIPEALPAVVTMALALGARRMVREHALIRRLPAVETLGSVTFVCSDKTGTLTENRMVVAAVETDRQAMTLPMTQKADEAQTLLMQALALNNDAAPGANDELVGDPTETALYRTASAAGVDKAALLVSMPRLAEVPFSSDRARMTTVHRENDGIVAFTKGAPERVIPSCVDRRTADGIEPVVAVELLRDVERLAASGLRVLAFAMRRLPALPHVLEDLETEQTFLGFVGLLDPPRAEAARAVAECRSAGIQVVMITGDHRATALAIARRLGIAGHDDDAITGSELAAMPADDLDARVRKVRVYARVAPEDKIRIVSALQRRGEYVAMTGDGVNDAPALRRADIGVSMGRAGTDVAREASHMVLLDDNFATIVTAVREGRRVYDNVRRFIRYSLSTNSGEIWTLFLAPFIGLPLPLLPIHILWMNLVTDGLPGLALAAEPAEHDVMERPPRPPGESVFANGLWQHAVWVGLLMAGVALATQTWAIHVGHAHWQSMTFTVLTLSQLGHVLAIRSERESLFRQGLLSNKPLAAAVGFTVTLQLCALYVPTLRAVFKTTPLSGSELAICVAAASTVFVAVEVEKFIRRFRSGWTGPRLQ